MVFVETRLISLHITMLIVIIYHSGNRFGTFWLSGNLYWVLCFRRDPEVPYWEYLNALINTVDIKIQERIISYHFLEIGKIISSERSMKMNLSDINETDRLLNTEEKHTIEELSEYLHSNNHLFNQRKIAEKWNDEYAKEYLQLSIQRITHTNFLWMLLACVNGQMPN